MVEEPSPSGGGGNNHAFSEREVKVKLDVEKNRKLCWLTSVYANCLRLESE